MSIDLSVEMLDERLKEFGLSIEAIDMDKVERNTLKRMAEEMRDMVRLAIRNEDDITSPARLNSKYEHGPGPSLARRPAWRVEQDGNKWIIRPNKKVEQRAHVLNFGYPGTITPDGDSPMPIEINGTPIFRWAVEGPDETGYWQAAFKMMEDSGRIEEIAEDELEIEFEEKI